MRPRVFAFWNHQWNAYHGFEGVLGSEVVRIGDDGYVRAEGFTGMKFKPVLILPIRPGRILHAKVECLRREYERAMEALNKEYKAKFKALFKEG